MLRTIAAGGLTLALAVAFGGTALGKTTVRDTTNNYRIDVPDGWTHEQNPSEDLKIVMVAPDRDETGGNCNVVTELHAPSKTMTQAQVDASIEKEVTSDAWAAMFKAIIFIQNVTIEKSGTEKLNGHKGHYVVASFSTVMPGEPVRNIKLKQNLVAIPGQLFFVTCSASHDFYTAKEEEFQTVFDSFSPLNDAVAANESVTPSLTLYAQARFSGISRIVTRDTPDLSVAGWRSPAGSLSVAGHGIWQVCDGANYAGTCQLVVGARHEKMTVGSVRRLPSAQASFRVMLQAAGSRSMQTILRRAP